jgi:hypothetical protein
VLIAGEHEGAIRSVRPEVLEQAVTTSRAWQVLFTGYHRPLKTFNSFCAAIGRYFFLESFRITSECA